MKYRWNTNKVENIIMTNMVFSLMSIIKIINSQLSWRGQL